MADPKTIANFDVLVEVFGAEKARQILRAIRTEMTTMQRASTRLVRTEGADEGAKTMLSNAQKRVALIKSDLKLREERVRVENSLAATAKYQSREQQEAAVAQARIEKERMRRMDAFNKQVDKASGLERARIVNAMSQSQRLMFQVQRFSQVFRRVTEALASFYLLRGITVFFRETVGLFVRSNIELEKMYARLRAINKGQGSFEELQKTILRLTIYTPFVISDFTEATVALTAFGINARKYLPVVADWAAAVGRNVSDVSVAFGKISIGSPRTALLLSTRGISKAEFDKELQRTQNASVALANIIERNFGGMAESISRTFAGMLSNIQDIWFQIAAIAGKPLFNTMRQDVEFLFNTLDVALKSSGGFLKEIGHIFAFIYTMLKGLIVPALVLIASKLYAGFQTLSKWPLVLLRMDVLSKGFIRNLITFAKLAPFIALAIHVERFNDELKNAIDEMNTLGKSMAGLGESRYIESLQRVVNAFKDTEGALGQIQLKLSDILDAYLQYFIDLWSGEFSKLPNFWKEILADRKAEYETAKKQLQIEKEIARERRLAFEWARIDTPKSLFELGEQIRGKSGGPELARRVAGFFATFSKNTTPFEGASLHPKIVEGFQKIGKSINEALSITEDRAKLEQFEYVINTLLPQYTKNLQSLGEDVKAEEVKAVLTELLEFLFDVPKDKAGHIIDFAALRDEIAALEAQLAELRAGQLPLTAKMNKELVAQAGFEQRILDIQAGTIPVRNKEEAVLQTTIELLKSRIRLLEYEKTAEENLISARDRLGEVARAYWQNLSEFRLRAAEHEYNMYSNLSKLDQARRDQYEELNDQLAITLQRVAGLERLVEGSRDKTGLEATKYNTLLMEARQEVMRLNEAMQQIIEQLAAQPSTTFWEGMSKKIREVDHELLNFNDTLASTVFDSIKEFGSGVLNDLLFGKGDDSEAKIVDLREQLAQVQVDSARQANAAKELHRFAYETNEQYEVRLNQINEITERSADEYLFKTKELELMEQINELEQERNDIILNRLRDLGKTVLDKIVDFGLTKGLSGLFGFGGLSPVNTVTPGPMIDSPLGGGGPGRNFGRIVIEGDVYGYDDFVAKVDGAMSKISYKRGR